MEPKRSRSTGGKRHGGPPRVHADRVAGGDRHHRHPDRPAAAGRAEGARGRRPHQCSNNLKQIALGLHNYASTTGHFPAAYTAEGFDQGWGWATEILRYAEQDAYYDAAQVGAIPFGSVNPAIPVPATKARIPLFRCPSDRGPDQNPARRDFGLSNYRAVAGPTTLMGMPYTPDADLGGMMYQNSKVQLADGVPDGLSNTLAVGEVKYDASDGHTAAIWAGMTGVWGGYIWISDVMYCIDGTTSQVNGTHTQAFGSHHFGGAYFGFGDGSVRFFRNATNPDLLRWVAGRNDGVIVPLDF